MLLTPRSRKYIRKRGQIMKFIKKRNKKKSKPHIYAVMKPFILE